MNAGRASVGFEPALRNNKYSFSCFASPWVNPLSATEGLGCAIMIATIVAHHVGADQCARTEGTQRLIVSHRCTLNEHRDRLVV